MGYFQNVFQQEFRQSWVLGDRQYSIDYLVGASRNSSNYILSGNSQPYNLSTYPNLTINYAWDQDFKNYSSLTINVAGANPAATLASEVVAALNANPTFYDYFQAQVVPNPNAVPNQSAPGQILITKQSPRPKDIIRTYISNGNAETILRFNKYAQVANVPNYMSRHTIQNRFAPQSQGVVPILQQVSQDATAISVNNPTQVTSANHGFTTGESIYIYGSNSTPSIDGFQTITVLDPNTFTVPINVVSSGDRGLLLNPINYQIVTEAGLVPTNYLFDYALLQGRTGLFSCYNQTIDGQGRITQIIYYPTGASVGDLARKTNYAYSGTNTNPTNIWEVPYYLVAADLVSPP